MTSGSILITCLVGLTCVGGVIGATLAGYSSITKSPAGEGGDAEQTTLSPTSAAQDHAAHPRTHVAALPSPSTRQEAPDGFERYIAGLGRLSAALRDPEYDWEAAEAYATASTPGQGGHTNTDFRRNVQKLFALAGTMEQLSDAMKQLRPNDEDRDIQSDPTPSAEAETNLPSGLNAALTTALADLSRLYDYYFGQESDGDGGISEEGKAMENEDGMQVLIDTLEALARAHTNYTAAIKFANTPAAGGVVESSTPEVPALITAAVNYSASTPTERIVESLSPKVPETSPHGLLSLYENQRGLQQVVTQLKALMGLEPVESSRNDTVLVTTTTTLPSSATTTTSRREHREQPCLPPFEMIAYRMCILQEMVLKLSWGDAQEFCRERGGMLAEDMVVIKTRRFLNDLYGEEGARSRWPVWVGGRRAGQTWVWGGGQRVPEFLWAPGEPRKFSSHLSPEGQCMMLDGYRRFYGASLPCYLRRRFVCQLNV